MIAATREHLVKALTDFWVGTDRNPQKMWDSWKDPHRTHVLNALMCLPTFNSLYELGCGAGPNLRLVKERWPQLMLSGSEPNEGLAMWAHEHLDVPIDNVEFPAAPDAAWDVALSCYALAYVDPETVRETLRNTESPLLVLIEPHAYVSPFGEPGVYEGHAMPCYVHNYLALAADAGYALRWRWPIYPPYQGLNQVLIAERT